MRLTRRRFRPSMSRVGPSLIGGLAVLAGIVWLALGLDARVAASDPESVTNAPPPPIEGTTTAELPLPTLRIALKQKHVLELRQKRAEAMQLGQLFTTDADLLPALINVDGTTQRVNLRLKGDLEDHWSGRKWSLRVIVRDGDTILGMRRFSLQDPRTRLFTSEWLYHRSLMLDGVLGLRYRFVRVYLNDQELGIYALEEHFSKELLEAQERREGVIVKFDETDFWLRATRSGPDLIADPMTLVGETPEAFRRRLVLDSEALSQERDAALRLALAFADDEVVASRVFKVRELARFLAISELLNSWHALRWHNLRFYYDPVAARLEPIGFDAMPGRAALERLHGLQERWVRQAVRDPMLAKAYVEELHRVSEPAYLERFRSLGSEWQQAVATIRKEWPEWDAGDIWKVITEKQQFLRNLLGTSKLLVAYAHPVADRLELRLGNIALLPVEVLGVRVGDGPLEPLPGHVNLPLLLHGKLPDQSMTYEEVFIPRPGPGAGTVRIVARLAGVGPPIEATVRDIDASTGQLAPRPVAPDLATVLARHPFLATGESPRWLVGRSGEWTVDGDLILPDGIGLRLPPGTTLRLQSDAVLVATGPLDLAGSPQAPVRILPIGESFAGIVVLGAPPSHWDNVEIGKTHGIQRPGWATTGGVTFQESPVELTSCRFLGSSAEDALNAIRTTVICRGCHFADTTSDAFDGDYVVATFERTSFLAIGGDAIDVSGSRARINEVTAAGIGDKAISAGEDSEVEISRLQVQRSRIAIASKDQSRVRVTDLRIRDCEIGLAAYVKKPEFGPASLKVDGMDVSMSPSAQTRRFYPAMCQPGSRIVVDGTRIPEMDFSTASLYVDP